MGEAEEVQVLLSIHTVDCSSWEDWAPQTACPGALVVVRIPDSETEIGESAFKDCRSMGKLIIPESVSKIHAGGGVDSFDVGDSEKRGECLCERLQFLGFIGLIRKYHEWWDKWNTGNTDVYII